MSKTILTTERLLLREFHLDDAEFIVELVNTPEWLQHIGDKKVANAAEARTFLQNGILKSYAENGFGLWLVALRDSQQAIGMCGLVNREGLAHVDIGFAMLPAYAGKGYGFESAQACMVHAKKVLQLGDIVGITDPGNLPSIKLLNKLGLRFAGTVYLPGNHEVILFAPPHHEADLADIDDLVASFYDLFTNVNGRQPTVSHIRDLFIPEGTIISNTYGKPEIFNLTDFIAPREKMLTNGTLTEFQEREISHRTDIYGNIAQRFSLYEKSGKLHGLPFASKGMKTMQFIRVDKVWKMSSVAWSDEINLAPEDPEDGSEQA